MNKNGWLVNIGLSNQYVLKPYKFNLEKSKRI